MAAPIRSRSKAWLILGTVLLAVSQMRWGIGSLAYLAPVPLLLYLRAAATKRERLWFALALSAGYILATVKIVTAPLPLAFALAFASPFAVFYSLAYLAVDYVRRRTTTSVGVLVFPAVMVVAEFIMHRFTPFGSWASAAYTQLDNLPLLQVASLVGLAGVSFVVYLVASAIEAVISEGRRALRPLVASLATLILTTAYGNLRLHAAAAGETVTVAAIGTDGTIGGWPLPSNKELTRVDEGLFARTAEAARAGAKLVAWNEAANAVLPENEARYQQRLQATAREHNIELVASYIVPHTETHTYENKYVWVRPNGDIDHIYNKHHPVPGEPAAPGTEPLKVVETAAGRATGAICYDFDFPALGLAQARLGIDLAVVPSSDWRGIDPIHTQMASVRAIEGGFSLLRSTRFGLSAGYDGYGRVRGWESSFDSDKRILLVGLPKQGVATLYTTIGDTFVGLCAAFALATTVMAAIAARRASRRVLAARPVEPIAIHA